MQRTILFLLIILTSHASAQNADSIMIRKIFDVALTKGEAYQNLNILCRDYGKRLAGSEGAAGAVEYTRKLMVAYGFDSVWLQPVMVPHWVRGEKETAYYTTENAGRKEMTICALGNSISTGKSGILAPVIEINDFSQLPSLGRSNIEGKIVFFNHPMDQTKIGTFTAYGEAVQYRYYGADRASKYGAVAVVVRSASTAYDDFPHTGSVGHGDSVKQIPACAISTMDAQELSAQLKKDPTTKFYFRQTCEMLADAPSFNVIGELRGTELPNEFITVGGHLDAWETGDGAHDDGAGVMQAMDVLFIMKTLGIRPRHTVRAVMFMNEENGGRGGKMYAEQARTKKEKHLFAIESDAGGFTPRGFGLDCNDTIRNRILRWKPLLEEYGLYEYRKFGGSDIEPLKELGTALGGLSPDSQRYFDLHHAANDTFDKVNRRELQLGAASMAALIYLIDKYGLN